MEFSFELGSIGAYSVRAIHIWSSFESVDAPPPLFVEIVYAILSKFHA